MNLQCMVGRHEWGPWVLRPATIAIRIEWLHWDRACQRGDRRWRCRAVDRRWFRIRVPASVRLGKAVTAAAYLARVKATAPRPESLPARTAPPRQAFEAMRR